MIYSKFGSQLVLVSKSRKSNGQLSIQATAGDTPDIREYDVDDMQADGGPGEISQAVAELPWKVFVGKAARRAQHLRR